ncbi:unnamed protein product, partial [Timema podura]|nr:unnamed protein product [Timema podura]
MATTRNKLCVKFEIDPVRDEMSLAPGGTTINDENGYSPLVSEVWTPERRKTVLEYLENCGHHHNLYAFRFVVCETLNFINVVGQIFFLDVFLAGEFIRYGPKVLSHVPDGHDIDPMARVFPKLAKCTFNYFGPSGT